MQKPEEIIGNCSTEQRAILSALASELFQKPLELPEQLDWDTVLAESVNQAVFPLVYNAVRDRLPSKLNEKWKTYFFQSIAANIRADAAHSGLHRLLTENAVAYVVLKGSASARYYPKPEMRMMGDVDFLVYPQDLERCGVLLESRGMRREDDGTHQYHRSYSYHSMEYEMHWAPPGIPNVGGEKIRACCEDMIEKAACASNCTGEYRVPSDYHHGLVLLLHTAGHMTSNGVGLRHLCDWAVFANHFSDETFCALFEKTLKEIGLWEFAKILTSVGTRFIGTPEKQWASGVDETLVEFLLSDIWGNGNLGKKDWGRQGYTAVLYEIYIDNIKDRSMTWSIASLINRKAKEFYPQLTRYSLLLPLGWIGALGRYGKMVLTGKKAPITPGKEYKKAMERRKLYQGLKLFEEQQIPENDL